MLRRFSSGPGGGMADTKVLEAFAVRCAGSSPVPGTIEEAIRGLDVSICQARLFRSAALQSRDAARRRRAMTEGTKDVKRVITRRGENAT
jgi:hypothetical protein